MQPHLLDLALPAPADIEAMAADPITWRAALDQAAKPFDHGAAASLVWAEFAEGRKVPIRAVVDTADYLVSCSCGNARFPCRHVLALLLRAVAEQPLDRSEPDWLSEQGDALQALARPQPLAPDEDARRLAALRAGLIDFEHRLADLIHWGLAALPARDPRHWAETADRLADAYAPELALDVRDLPLLTIGVRDWPAVLLPRLGRLQLLAEAFRRYDDLPAAARGDLRRAVGLPPVIADDTEAISDAVADRWLVVGRGGETTHKQRRRRTWLYGTTTGRHALLEEIAAERDMHGRLLPVGALIEATAVFQTSAWPLAAALLPGLRLLPPPASLPPAAPDFTSSITDALGQAAAARMANPWLRRFPAALGGVRVEPVDGGWRVRDRAGALLPLPDKFPHGWHLLAVGGGRPLDLFGEWDGARFTPLSVRLGRWSPISRWKGVG